MAPKVESTGGWCAVTISPGVETTAVKVEEKSKISDNPMVMAMIGISGNPEVSSSGEPSTVGVDVVTTSAVSAAV